MKAKTDKPVCATKYCRRNAYCKPNGKHERYCTKCRSDRWKASKPFSYHFNALRNNARRRGKDFRLTIEEYTEFAIKNKLFDENGAKYNNKTIDRREDLEGYHKDNLQVLSRPMNTRKQWVDYYRNNYDIIPEEDRGAWEAYQAQFNTDLQAELVPDDEEDLPF